MKTAQYLLLSVVGAFTAARGQVSTHRPDAKLIPAPGGEIAIVSTADRTAYDTYKYAPARRAGDYIYISGVVISRLPDGDRTPDTFKSAVRVGFEKLNARLNAFGAKFADVVMINSFHDWTAVEFAGDRMAQFTAFNEVKEEFMTGDYPAWTAVGTSGLIRDAGIVEVQMIAYAPVVKSAHPKHRSR